MCVSAFPNTVFDPKGEAGVTAPFGFFDPLALCPDTEKEFIKFRESELKHGRVAMLAFAGFFGNCLLLFSSSSSVLLSS